MLARPALGRSVLQAGGERMVSGRDTPESGWDQAGGEASRNLPVRMGREDSRECHSSHLKTTFAGMPLPPMNTGTGASVCDVRGSGFPLSPIRGLPFLSR